MNLNIREFPEALGKRLKLESFKRGVTLRKLVIAILDYGDAAGEALDFDKQKEGKNGDDLRMRGSAEGEEKQSRGLPRGERGRGVRGAHEAGGSQGESGAVGDGARKDSGAKRKGEVTAVNLTGDRPSHDVTTCRVYGCGICKAAGKKF